MIEALLQAERLLVHGMVDQAEQIYQRTLEGDPRNAIAVVGLARVALERGDDRLAYQRAREALELDSRNPAALRLEARMAEVLRARGETVDRPAWLMAEQPPVAAPEPDAQPELPTAARESEQVMLARNPSMADHRQRMERPTDASAAQRTPAEPAATEPPRPHPASTPHSVRRRRPRGILRRLLGG